MIQNVRFHAIQAVTVGVHREEKKKRLHVLTALVLLLHFWLSSCKTGMRVHCQFQPEHVYKNHNKQLK